jgi:hypothetical protein
VVVDNIEVARTFLNEARMLDSTHRRRVVAARDHYESAFRRVIEEGVEDGSFRADVDPKTASIYILSVLNAIERWYDPAGPLDGPALVASLSTFAGSALA